MSSIVVVPVIQATLGQQHQDQYSRSEHRASKMSAQNTQIFCYDATTWTTVIGWFQILASTVAAVGSSVSAVSLRSNEAKGSKKFAFISMVEAAYAFNRFLIEYAVIHCSDN